jgi:hypothetical protein
MPNNRLDPYRQELPAGQPRSWVLDLIYPHTMLTSTAVLYFPRILRCKTRESFERTTIQTLCCISVVSYRPFLVKTQQPNAAYLTSFEA